MINMAMNAAPAIVIPTINATDTPVARAPDATNKTELSVKTLKWFLRKKNFLLWPDNENIIDQDQDGWILASCFLAFY